MKKFLFPLFTLFSFLILKVQSQSLVIEAPSDLVVSSKFQFIHSNLSDPNDPTFGRLVFDLNSRKKIVTLDNVCHKFCRKNLWTGYPGNLNVNQTIKPVSTKACEYYNSYFDTAHNDRKYELNWGFDGYSTGEQAKLKEILINDFRKCDQGLIQRIFIVEDVKNNSARDTQDIWIVDCDYNFPISLACNNEVFLSLDNKTCELTLDASMFLSGSKACNSAYNIQIRHWVGSSMNLIDRNPNLPGIQLGKEDLNKEYRFTIIDPVTGNSCWGKAQVEYKIAPSIDCPDDITISCFEQITPNITGQPKIGASCINSQISYIDQHKKGSCDLGYSWLIVRTWKVVDENNKIKECLQHITVNNSSINDVVYPLSLDGIQSDALKCHEQIDTLFDASIYTLDTPRCVGAFLLDSAYWIANPQEPDIFPNRRRPRILGWNMIPSSISPTGFIPSPDPIYYKAYRDLTGGADLCWADNSFIMWKGTGKPSGSECLSLSITYEDIVISVADPACSKISFNCLKVLRKWTVLDWCSGNVNIYNQVIKVVDTDIPDIIYPSVIEINTDLPNNGQWLVAEPGWVDNCSQQIRYTIETTVGNLQGDEIKGYILTNLPIGEHVVTIVLSDCCGNINRKQIILKIKMQSMVNQLETSPIKLYPNPTSGKFKIAYEGNYDQLVLQSLDGKIVVRQQKSMNEEYNFTGLPLGVYVLQIFDENQMIETEKLVLSK